MWIKRSFATLIKFMVDSNGLTDAQILMAMRCGVPAMGQLTGGNRPTFAERRNTLALGDSFERLPTGALLLKLLRGLINFVCGNYNGQIVKMGALPASAGPG